MSSKILVKPSEVKLSRVKVWQYMEEVKAHFLCILKMLTYFVSSFLKYVTKHNKADSLARGEIEGEAEFVGLLIVELLVLKPIN